MSNFISKFKRLHVSIPLHFGLVVKWITKDLRQVPNSESQCFDDVRFATIPINFFVSPGDTVLVSFLSD